MPKAQLCLADEFIVGLSQIYSERLLQRIRGLLASLAEVPEMGSQNVRQSLVDRYGPNLQKLPVSTFVIVYRYETDTVDVLAIVYGPSIT